MALPDKHQLKFNIYKDVKSLMEAIEKRFDGNKETKKVQKTLLKQQYENFTGSSSESLDQIHDRLQKLISQLEILDESLSQEDINMKFLRSLPSDNESVSAVTSISATSTKILVSALPNVDNSSDVVIYSFLASQFNSPQLDNNNLKQIDANDLEKIRHSTAGTSSLSPPQYRRHSHPPHHLTTSTETIPISSPSSPLSPPPPRHHLSHRNHPITITTAP
nr:hypothetical protein [Tanacetum cinerariifolium]